MLILSPVLSFRLYLTQTRRNAARAVLFVSLETSLRLLHPFMPFLTEELWQRLPRPASASPSVMLAPFPTSPQFLDLDMSALDSQMQVPLFISLVNLDQDKCVSFFNQQLLAILHATRSLRDSFGIEGLAPFVVHVLSDAGTSILLRSDMMTSRSSPTCGRVRGRTRSIHARQEH